MIRSETGRGTETAAVAQWMIGETYFMQKQYNQAIKAYHRVESLYDYPRWQAAALLQAGKCHEMVGRWSEAMELYARIVNDYAQTRFADKAVKRLRVAQQRAELDAHAVRRCGPSDTLRRTSDWDELPCSGPEWNLIERRLLSCGRPYCMRRPARLLCFFTLFLHVANRAAAQAAIHRKSPAQRHRPNRARVTRRFPPRACWEFSGMVAC